MKARLYPARRAIRSIFFMIFVSLDLLGILGREKLNFINSKGYFFDFDCQLNFELLVLKRKPCVLHLLLCVNKLQILRNVIKNRKIQK